MESKRPLTPGLSPSDGERESGSIPNNIEERKALLRRNVRQAVRALREKERQSLSRLACALLQEQEAWRSSKAILFYAPLPDEIDIWPLMTHARDAGKIIALPRFIGQSGNYEPCQLTAFELDVQIGRFGIREPKPVCAKMELNRLDLVLVPGIAFDLQGRRLGRGKGYYDRLLANLHVTTCGVAFDEQIVEQIPVAPHDRHVNCILTPTRWLRF